MDCDSLFFGGSSSILPKDLSFTVSQQDQARELLRYMPCGCISITLAQGHAILLCRTHDWIACGSGLKEIAPRGE